MQSQEIQVFKIVVSRGGGARRKPKKLENEMNLIIINANLKNTTIHDTYQA